MIIQLWVSNLFFKISLAKDSDDIEETIIEVKSDLNPNNPYSAILDRVNQSILLYSCYGKTGTSSMTACLGKLGPRLGYRIEHNKLGKLIEDHGQVWVFITLNNIQI